MTNQSDVEIFKTADAETLDLIFREASDRVASQVELMIAADGRALGLLGAATALAAAAAAVAADQLNSSDSAALVRGASVAALVFSVSAAVTIITLWPTDVSVRGWHPNQFIQDIAEKRPANQMKAEMVAFMQERLDINAKIASKNSILTIFSMIALAIAPLAGLAAAVLG